MRWMGFLVLWGLLGAAAPACDTADSGGGTDTSLEIASEPTPDTAARELPDDEASPTPSGTLRVLTYNVAGLPQGISGSDPETNIPQISPLLNDYDLALVQEDFSYHEELAAEATHPYQSAPWSERFGEQNIGDGLNRFSVSPFGDLERIPWPDCNGLLDCASDCMATKGFSVARHALAPGVQVDVYNLHMEAGGCPGDEVIREAGVTLLLETIAARSAGLPVLIAGDFNLHEDDAPDLDQLQRLTAAGLVDVCWSLECGETNIDRIFVRDGDALSWEPLAWEVPAGFVTSEGAPLSDHEPVAAVLSFSGS